MEVGQVAGPPKKNEKKDQSHGRTKGLGPSLRHPQGVAKSIRVLATDPVPTLR